jgi:hypothetical protein
VALVRLEGPTRTIGRRLTALIDRSGLTLGSLAGLIGISCCVAPTILALLGLISASVAIGLGTTLYWEYGWYFRGAGLVFAAIGVGGLLSRRQSCSRAGARAQWRLLAWTVLSMVVVYAALYWLTALLARAASR